MTNIFKDNDPLRSFNDQIDNDQIDQIINQIEENKKIYLSEFNQMVKKMNRSKRDLVLSIEENTIRRF